MDKLVDKESKFKLGFKPNLSVCTFFATMLFCAKKIGHDIKKKKKDEAK